jgi:hypothetical protein
MGNPFLLQACLKLDKGEIPSPLEIGKEYKFSKNGHRIYQINIPMDLRDNDWNAYGRCVVTEYTLGNDKTMGTYVIVKIFDSEQAKHVTNTYVSDEEVKNILSNIK